MDTEKLTTPFTPASTAPVRRRTFSGATPDLGSEPRNDGRAPFDPTAAPASIRRATESHWEWIIDRATD